MSVLPPLPPLAQSSGLSLSPLLPAAPAQVVGPADVAPARVVGPADAAASLSRCATLLRCRSCAVRPGTVHVDLRVLVHVVVRVLPLSPLLRAAPVRVVGSADVAPARVVGPADAAPARVVGPADDLRRLLVAVQRAMILRRMTRQDSSESLASSHSEFQSESSESMESLAASHLESHSESSESHSHSESLASSHSRASRSERHKPSALRAARSCQVSHGSPYAPANPADAAARSRSGPHRPSAFSARYRAIA